MKVMKVVISCAKSKACNAGYMKTEDERRCVKFVGDPDLAKAVSPMPGFCYARPDDEAKDGKTWREELVAYNKSCKDENPFGLLRAYKLYKNPVYRELVDTFCLKNVYILSAGWGLIRASFLTPNYDITFGGSGYKRRRKRDQYCDFNHLESAMDEDLLFFGGHGYLPLFCKLTRHYQGRRIVYYNSQENPNCDNVELVHYETKDKYRWVYKCAEKAGKCYKSDPCGFDPLKKKDELRSI